MSEFCDWSKGIDFSADFKEPEELIGLYVDVTKTGFDDFLSSNPGKEKWAVVVINGEWEGRYRTTADFIAALMRGTNDRAS